MLQKVLPLVANNELAAVAFAVDLGAAVAVQDRVPELAMRLRVRHGLIVPGSYDSSG